MASGDVVFLMSKLTKIEEYLRAWEIRLREKEKELEGRRKKALKQAKAAARLLKKKFKIRKVFLTGSVLDERFTLDSDIDLVVEGLHWKKYLRALHEVNELCVPFKVDLFPLEELKNKQLFLSRARRLI